MMNKSGKVLGGILIVLGILFLMKNLDIFARSGNFSISAPYCQFWPLFLLLPGLLFHYGYFRETGETRGCLCPGHTAGSRAGVPVQYVVR